MNVCRGAAVAALVLALGLVTVPGQQGFCADGFEDEEVSSESTEESADTGEEAEEPESDDIPEDAKFFLGKIKSVTKGDEEEIIVATGRDGKDASFTVSPVTRILKGGEVIPLSEMKKGDEVCILFFEDEWGKEIYRVTVRAKDEKVLDCARKE